MAGLCRKTQRFGKMSYVYDEYYKVKKEVEDFARENKIPVTEVEYGYYPEEIEW